MAVDPAGHLHRADGAVGQLRGRRPPRRVRPTRHVVRLTETSNRRGRSRAVGGRVACRPMSTPDVRRPPPAAALTHRPRRRRRRVGSRTGPSARRPRAAAGLRALHGPAAPRSAGPTATAPRRGDHGRQPPLGDPRGVRRPSRGPPQGRREGARADRLVRRDRDPRGHAVGAVGREPRPTRRRDRRRSPTSPRTRSRPSPTAGAGRASRSISGSSAGASCCPTDCARSSRIRPRSPGPTARSTSRSPSRTPAATSCSRPSGRRCASSSRRASRRPSSRTRVTADGLAAHLYTSGSSDPDLIVRTSGEVRLSGSCRGRACTASTTSATRTGRPSARSISCGRSGRSRPAAAVSAGSSAGDRCLDRGKPRAGSRETAAVLASTTPAAKAARPWWPPTTQAAVSRLRVARSARVMTPTTAAQRRAGTARIGPAVAIGIPVRVVRPQHREPGTNGDPNAGIPRDERLLDRGDDLRGARGGRRYVGGCLMDGVEERTVGAREAPDADSHDPLQTRLDARDGPSRYRESRRARMDERPPTRNPRDHVRNGRRGLSARQTSAALADSEIKAQ